MARTLPLTHARPRHSALPRLADLAALYRQRKTLGQLDAARIDDLGISAEEARREACKPIWDVPAHWRR
ncbi:hypothetical protein [Marinovum sp.]|uniref:DUF1127 domain-containing protein n=1 Tax=Marinovum sp. TaxID=2024839 RepID=UPI002B27587D|nr:hypothetical protein [Marinovum sp.]